jgi:predicted nucleic acid-binding protein
LSVVVVDAALVVDLICGFPAGEPYRERLAAASGVAAPAHLDAEVLSALGRLKRAGQLTAERERVQALARFPARRWPLRPLLESAWALTDRIAVRDALYVALAASLDATLLTTDSRLRTAAEGIVAVAHPDEGAPAGEADTSD